MHMRLQMRACLGGRGAVLRGLGARGFECHRKLGGGDQFGQCRFRFGLAGAGLVAVCGQALCRFLAAGEARRDLGFLALGFRGSLTGMLDGA